MTQHTHTPSYLVCAQPGPIYIRQVHTETVLNILLTLCNIKLGFGMLWSFLKFCTVSLSASTNDWWPSGTLKGNPRRYPLRKMSCHKRLYTSMEKQTDMSSILLAIVWCSTPHNYYLCLMLHICDGLLSSHSVKNTVTGEENENKLHFMTKSPPPSATPSQAPRPTIFSVTLRKLDEFNPDDSIQTRDCIYL